MQAETIELEEIEITESKSKVKKEFEKILIRERNRKLNMKAQNLIKLGCFDQHDEKTVDFSRLDKITYDKPYKKLYDLYMDKEGNLFYIFGKTEGESSKPYAYDVIAIETVTDEEYKELYKANTYEGAGFIRGLFVTAFSLWVLSITISLSIFIYYIASGEKFIDILVSCISFIFFIGILTCTLAITSVSYRKYIGK